MNPILVRESSLRERVAAEIIRLVSVGDLPPGTTLTEKGAAEMFGVSRTPAREALLKLSDSGILVTGSFKGFRVAEVSVEDANWLYDCIICVERQAVRALASTPYDKKVLQSVYQSSLIRMNAGIFEYWMADQEFHETIVQMSGNPHLAAMSKYVRNGLSRYVALYMSHDYSTETSASDHGRLVDALLAEDYNSAIDLVTAHWMSARRKVIGWLMKDEGNIED